MAKTQIHKQEEALSVYFDDMLTTPKPTPNKKSAAAEQAVVEPPKTTNTAAAVTAERPDMLRLLLCDIDGIPLALPLSTLNNIVHWPQQGLQQLPDQPDWQLGLFSQKQKNSQVVDLRNLLQTESRSAAFQANYILLVDERRWGIACHRIGHIISCQSDAINWSDDLSQSPWFMGVVNDGQYQIIDIPAVLAALEQS